MKGIIFDLDGVLINSAPDMAVSINKTLEYFGFSTINFDLIPTFIGNGARVLLVRSLATSLGYTNPEEIIEVVSKDTVVYDDGVQLLHVLGCSWTRKDIFNCAILCC